MQKPPEQTTICILCGEIAEDGHRCEIMQHAQIIAPETTETGCEHPRVTRMPDEKGPTETTNLAAFLDKIKTPEMAQKIAHRLEKHHGAFAAFAITWIEAMSALEQEMREQNV